MFEAPPKMINSQCQKYADLGFASAKRGETADALNQHPDLQGFASPILRSAWLQGWEGGGGDIMLGLVVTETQRLARKRVALLAQIERIDARLKELGEPQSADEVKP